MVQNHTCWWARCAVQKQCNSYQSTWICLCFGSPNAQLSAAVLPSLLPVLPLVSNGQRRRPKDYDSSWGFCTGQIYYFARVTGLLQFQARLHRPPCFLLGALLRFATTIHKRRIQICYESSCSVVIRAAKLKFVADNKTRVYFAQHVASTCNTVFCCETSWSQKW